MHQGYQQRHVNSPWRTRERSPACASAGRLKLNALPCYRFTMDCQSNFSWHWHSPCQALLLLAAATSLQFMSKARLHRSQKVPPFVLYSVLLHESRVQKQTRLSEMMDAVHSGAHSSKAALDLLCVYWTQRIFPMVLAKWLTLQSTTNTASLKIR